MWVEIETQVVAFAECLAFEEAGTEASVGARLPIEAFEDEMMLALLPPVS